MTGAALDFVRFDLKVGYWSQYGRYFQVKPNPPPVELSGSNGGVLDWGSKGCYIFVVRDSLPGVTVLCPFKSKRFYQLLP